MAFTYGLTASGKKFHAISKHASYLTVCGERVARTVDDPRRFGALEERACYHCLGSSSEWWAQPEAAVGPEPTPEKPSEAQEPPPEPQERPHKGMRPVRGRRRST
jgi:hypothetical protein